MIKKEKVLDYDIITIKNEAGLEVCFSSYGAAVYYIKLDGVLMSASFKDIEEYLTKRSYYGKTLGRVAGRIKDATYNLPNGKILNLEKNDNGINSTMGGFNNLSYKNYEHTIVENNDGTYLIFSYVSKDGEAGYNGLLDVKITYFIPRNDNSLTIMFAALPNETTILNLSNHLYFNIGETKDIYDTTLYLATDLVGILDDALVVKSYEKCDDILNFTTPKKLGKDIADPRLHATRLNGYDHRYKYENSDFDTLKASLITDKYRLDAYSTYDSVIVYANGFPKDIYLLDGEHDHEHKSVTLEFMASEPIVQQEKEQYFHKTKYVFTKL